MLLFFGWLLLSGYLLSEGHEVLGTLVLGGGLLLFIIVGINASEEEAKARANRRRYWAHYYDEYH